MDGPQRSLRGRQQQAEWQMCINMGTRLGDFNLNVLQFRWWEKGRKKNNDLEKVRKGNGFELGSRAATSASRCVRQRRLGGFGESRLLEDILCR